MTVLGLTGSDAATDSFLAQIELDAASLLHSEAKIEDAPEMLLPGRFSITSKL